MLRLVRHNICIYQLVPIGRLLTSQYTYSVFLSLLIAQCLFFLPRNQRTYKQFFFPHLVKHSEYYLSQLIRNEEANAPPNQLLFIQITSPGPGCLGFCAHVWILPALTFWMLLSLSLSFKNLLVFLFYHPSPHSFPPRLVLLPPKLPLCIFISSLISFSETIHCYLA